MLSRRTWGKSVLGVLATAAFATPVVAQQPEPTTGDANLAETLTYGLKPRTPAEEAFLASVVAKVEAKTLPLELVVSTFRWARPKKPYPFPFFERALRLRAAQLGVVI